MLFHKTTTMTRKEIFSKLWELYTVQNPSVLKVHKSFTNYGEEVINDHVAFRTFNDPRMDIDVLERLFIYAGYVKKGDCHFEEKKLIAKHYEVPGHPEEPKVFISQLILEEFSEDLQSIITSRINSIDNIEYRSRDLLYSGNIWGKPSYKAYHKLREESEYAAWLYVYGFCVNHFTISINHLKKLDSIEVVNQHLKDHGFLMNISGGEIKGTREELLQQSSIMAENIKIEFIEGQYEIPACYYEFAVRYPDTKGNLYNGFLAKNANKIFESTNFHGDS